MNARVFIPVDKATFYRFIAREPEERYEFERGRIVQQMAGGTRNHFKIAGRIRTLLVQQLDPAKWEALHERGVETADSVRFADVVVEPASEPGNSVSTLRPAVIVEVLSPSSLDRDLDPGTGRSSVGDRVDRSETARRSGVERRAHGRCAFGFDTNDTTLRPKRFDGGGNARDQPATTDRNDNGGNVG